MGFLLGFLPLAQGRGAVDALASMVSDHRPLVMHVLHRFDTGGLENGVVNLINHMPERAYRHMVLALTEVTAFRQRLQRDDVECVALNKSPGHGVKLYPRLLHLFREYRPAVVHTRNLGPLEMQAAAAMARVPARVHGEHGRELDDLDGNNAKYQWVRRMYSPFVHRYVALSQDLERYLVGRVGIAGARVSQIYNGVDTQQFGPPVGPRLPVPGCPFDINGAWFVGTVGRMQGVKDQCLLARAFARALTLAPSLRARARLIMIGDGPLRAESQLILNEAGVGDLAWLPGERADVADVMRMLDCFVLPSLAEGISNTILEAMATGLPVVATAVGGNPELVEPGVTGELVPASNVEALAEALVRMAQHPERSVEMGLAAHAEVQRRFSLQAMVSAYQQLYDSQLLKAGYRQGSG